MTALTIEVSDQIADVLKSLDDPLEMGPYTVHEVLLFNIHEAHDDLWALSERPVDELVQKGPATMRRLARRLVVLADACDAAEAVK